jgi:hypothetical protein
VATLTPLRFSVKWCFKINPLHCHPYPHKIEDDDENEEEKDFEFALVSLAGES